MLPDFRDYIGSSSMQVKKDLIHYGTPRHSGRYPWGSGDRPYQSLEKKKKDTTTGREKGFLDPKKFFVNDNTDSSWADVKLNVDELGNILNAEIPEDDIIDDLKNDDYGTYYKGYVGLTKDDVKACNPKYGINGTTNNCVKCTTAMELRKRGYDVQAGYSNKGASADLYTELFPGSTRTDYNSYDDIEDNLRNQGPGASGALLCFFPDNIGGHSIYYNVKRNGNVDIYDGQSGKTYDGIDSLYSQLGFGKTNSETGKDFTALSIRLDEVDTKDINFDLMANEGMINTTSDKDFNSTGFFNRNTGRAVGRW